MRAMRRFIRYLCDGVAYDVVDTPSSVCSEDEEAVVTGTVHEICHSVHARAGLFDCKRRAVPVRAVASGAKFAWQIDPIGYCDLFTSSLSDGAGTSDLIPELRRLIIGYVSTCAVCCVRAFVVSRVFVYDLTCSRVLCIAVDQSVLDAARTWRTINQPLELTFTFACDSVAFSFGPLSISRGPDMSLGLLSRCDRTKVMRDLEEVPSGALWSEFARLPRILNEIGDEVCSCGGTRCLCC